jgi:UDP-glucose 4-epimerase
MIALVIGGNGFIGSALVLRLVDEGYMVRVLDPGVPRPDIDWTACEYIQGDLSHPAVVDTAVSGADIVFHLASTTVPGTSNLDPHGDVTSNLLGLLNLLASMRHVGVNRLVFLSSGGTVYGPPRSLPVAESHPTDPISSYGIHKLMVEKYLQLAHRLHGFDYRIVRPANLYGPRQRLDTAQGAVAVFLDRALRDEPIQIWGDGSVVRDYAYVADAVDAMLRAARYEGAERIFNIGTGVGVSLNQLVAEIGKVLGRRIKVEHGAPRALDVPANVLDCTLARRHLGWSASTSLQAGLQRTCGWLRSAR